MKICRLMMVAGVALGCVALELRGQETQGTAGRKPSDVKLDVTDSGLPATANTGGGGKLELKLNDDPLSGMGGPVYPGPSLDLVLPPPVVPGVPATLPGEGLTASTQPASGQPAATQPAVVRDEFTQKVVDHLRRAEYRAALDELRLPVREGKATSEQRQVYITCLVATDRLSAAAFEAARAAKAYPETFLKDVPLASVYRENPDYVKHAKVVEDLGLSATKTEPGILCALYQRLAGISTEEVHRQLGLLNLGTGEKEWMGKLRKSLEKEAEGSVGK